MSGRVAFTPPVFELPPEPKREPVAVAETENAAPVERSVAVGELLGFDARLIASLPLATTLVCEQANGAGQFVVTTSQARYEAARAAKVVVLVGRELAALATAAENDRASAPVLAEWCERKRADASWRLTSDVALGGVCDVVPPQGWLLEQVLRAFGAELVAVGVRDEEPT